MKAGVARLGGPSAAHGVLKCGFLTKKGHVLPTRKERYFVLGEHSLSYYKPTKDDKVELKGLLDLSALDVITPLPHSDVWFRVRKSEGSDGKSYRLDLKDLLGSPMQHDTASTPRVDLRASFQVFHEMVLLQKLVDKINSSWGPPKQWTMAQYQELVQSISLAQERSGSSELENHSILAEAFQLRYQFEEIPENQRKLSRDDDPLGAAKSPVGSQQRHSALSAAVAPRMSPRVRCPSFHSYYATFEELSDRVGDYGNVTGDDGERIKALTPRSATLAKYAHLYLQDDIRAKQPWSLDRVDGDDLIAGRMHGASDETPILEAGIVEALVGRFETDRIYTCINHHTMLVLNPYRLLQTSRFTSIYDEQVVLTYAETAHAETSLAPHPFAIAKQSILRLFFDRNSLAGANSMKHSTSTEASKRGTPVSHCQSLFLSGESGSGKTELAKDLLKYLVLVAQPTLSRDSSALNEGITGGRRPTIKLFTSSTKSTIQMRTEEARTIALLEAKGVESYEIVLLDLYPERWEEMTVASRSKRLPQVHVDGLFFGFYEKLEHLEDEEQLRMYFKNPQAAKKLSTVLDSNILLEAFGHASTSMNLNSSRFGKVTTLYISFGRHPQEFQVGGCHISPFLLEKARVTSQRRDRGDGQSDMNFHVLYSMVVGVNAFPFMRLLAKDLQLDGVECSAFAYLGRCDHQLAGFVNKQDTWKQDVERWQHVIDAMDELNLSTDQQKTIFQVLSAVLWLGNIEFTHNARLQKLEMASSAGGSDAPLRVAQLLGLESVDQLGQMLMTRKVALHSTGETFEVALEKGQVDHVRDALARLLYQLAFEHIVATMNAVTKMDASPARSGVNEEAEANPEAMLTRGVSLLKIVDVFGFEDLAHNSLDQLCINYLSEKLFAREEQIVRAAYAGDASLSSHRLLESPRDVLFLYEHPLGVFASLEELTLLHQSENETAQQEEKRNMLFVRNIYERNAHLLSEPPRALKNDKRQSSLIINALPFVIPHARGDVVYDANEFVKKNSDFVYANLRDGLEASSNIHLRQMLSTSKTFSASSGGTSTIKSTSGPVDARPSGSRSFVGQFRSQVTVLASGNDAHMPFYFHCIRPNANKQPSVATNELVGQQVRAQRLLQQVQVCSDAASSYAAIAVPKNVVIARYGCLLRAPRAIEEVAGDDEALLLWLSDLLSGEDSSSPKMNVDASANVQFASMGLVEKLELLLEERETEAAATVQSLFLMIMWRRRYLSKKRERRGLSNELLAWYGPEKTDTIKKLLKKYNGREDELRSKLARKKQAQLQEKRMVDQLASDLEALCLGSHGGLDSQAVNDILHDETMRHILQQNEKIVLALRDMSLSPDMLAIQLEDPELRAFYEQLVVFLQSKKEGTTPDKSDHRLESAQRQIPLDERVLAVATEKNRDLWMRLAQKEEWAAHRNALEEVGEDPELLLFHSEDDDFVTTLERFLNMLAEEAEHEEEQKALAAITSLVQPSVTHGEETQDTIEGNGADTELVELLQSVEFGPPLMTAMSQDTYFVQALQDPMLMSSMQQVRALVIPCSVGFRCLFTV
ncbi:hypothetical protein BBJ28_00015911 [Nothophytophthora sp. Chile5]|nr:hypothetical protein BBJ28_00015911 [Nothophytophthora sp. Chile5]